MATYKISTADADIEWGLSGDERIVQNVLNILRTKQSEIPFMREMGIDPDYLDANLEYIRANMVNDVVELIEEYEPRATIVDVNVEGVDANGNIIIEAEVEV